jgi:predicted alpha/beta hydrolase family esterase
MPVDWQACVLRWRWQKQGARGEPAARAAHTCRARAVAPSPSPARPRRPDAAIIVAAEDDAYVCTESVRQLHRYWEGSELRLVSGGHGEP